MSIHEALTARQQFDQGIGVYEQARFGRVITAMVTPFAAYDTYHLDIPAAQDLARYLVEHGSEGLVLAGTTGESATLTHEEELELFAAVREAVDVPILAGTGSNDTRTAVNLTREVAEQGTADGVLVVGPYYNRPTQYGIEQHYRAIAAATDLPVVVYNIPKRTGRDISDKTLLALAEVNTIVALKDAAGDLARTVWLRRQLPEDFEIYSGDDSLNLRLALEAGVSGAISVASHWAGPEIQAMYDNIAWGQIDSAQEIDQRLGLSYRFEGSDEAANPSPTKAMMRVLGLQVGYCRPPMGESPATEQMLEQQAAAIIDKLAPSLPSY